MNFVQARFKSAKLQITNDNTRLFYTCTGGNTLLCSENANTLLSLSHPKKCRRITEDLVSRSWQDMLDEFDGEFESRFSTRFSDQQRAIMKTVAALSPLTLTGIAKKLGNKTTDISSSVSRLVEAMILHKDRQGRYTLTDEVFKDWLLSP